MQNVVRPVYSVANMTRMMQSVSTSVQINLAEGRIADFICYSSRLPMDSSGLDAYLKHGSLDP